MTELKIDFSSTKVAQFYKDMDAKLSGVEITAAAATAPVEAVTAEQVKADEPVASEETQTPEKNESTESKT